MQSDFNPYQQWLGIDGPGPPNHYQLLGVPDFEADPERIWSSAHKRRAVLQAKQYSDDAQLAARLISEVDAAERCLLSPYDKEQYDQQLRSAAAAAEQAAAAQAADAAPLAEPAHPPEKKPSSNWGYDDDSPAPMRPEDFLPPPASPGDFVPPAAFGQPSPQPGAPVAGMPPYGQPLPPTAGDPMPGGQAPMAAMPGDPANGFGTPVAGLPPAATPAEPFPPAEPPMAEVLGTAPMASPLFPQAPMANPGYDPLPKAPSPAAPAPLAGTPVPAASVPPSATMGTPVANPMPSAVAAAQAADDFPLPAAAPLGTAPSAQPEPAGPHVVAPGRRWAPARSNSLFLAVGAPVAAVVIIGLLVLFVTESGPFGSGPVAKKSVSTDPGKRPEPPAPIPTPKPMPKPPEPKSNSDLGPKPPEPKPPEPKPKLPEPKTPDPKPKPPEPKPKADPGQMKLVTTALLSARYWLADRDLDKADEAYALAKKNDPTGARRDDLEGVRELIHYNREFWKAVRGQCKDLKGGSIIRLQGQNVGVVEAREDYLILREAGRNKRYTFKAMKVGYAYDLAALFLTKSDPVTHVILGAFLVAEYEGDRDQARGHWQTAMRTGDEDLQKQVELLLPTLAVKIPAEPVPLPGEEPAGPQRGPDGRYPLPEGDVLAKAQAAVTEMYKPRIDAAVFEADKAALARDVLKEADGDDVDPTTRFVLLGQARDLAAAGEDFPLAMQTVDALAESYVVDAMAMKIDLIAAGTKSVKDPEASKALVKLALEYADEAVLLEQFSLALRLTNAARTAAAKSKDPALIKEAASRHKEITALKSSS